MPVDLNNLSISELKRIKTYQQQKLKKEFSQYKEKQKLIADIKKIEKYRKKIQPKSKPTKPRVKSFDEYFQECIKNRTIPLDTRSYLKHALGRALKEYEQAIIKEKSALEDFAEKYIIKGEPDVSPIQFFQNKAQHLKDFLPNHRNIKVRFVLVCLMEKIKICDGKPLITQTKAYFQSDTHINLESTDVKEILVKMIKKILNSIKKFQRDSSDWYFKEVIQLEFHTVQYKPMNGASYIPLPDFIMRKKAIINVQNKDEKCFLWSVLRYLHPANKNEIGINDLKKYENDLNMQDIDFSSQIKRYLQV